MVAGLKPASSRQDWRTAVAVLLLVTCSALLLPGAAAQPLDDIAIDTLNIDRWYAAPGSDSEIDINRLEDWYFLLLPQEADGSNSRFARDIGVDSADCDDAAIDRPLDRLPASLRSDRRCIDVLDLSRWDGQRGKGSALRLSSLAISSNGQE